jgi:hypothetical protein
MRMPSGSYNFTEKNMESFNAAFEAARRRKIT